MIINAPLLLIIISVITATIIIVIVNKRSQVINYITMKILIRRKNMQTI